MTLRPLFLLSLAKKCMNHDLHETDNCVLNNKTNNKSKHVPLISFRLSAKHKKYVLLIYIFLFHSIWLWSNRLTCGHYTRLQSRQHGLSYLYVKI